MTTQHALSVEHVTKRYAGVVALSDVSMSVARGEVVGLLGANGAGKSTLLDIIGGEQAADEGEVVLAGRRLSGPPHRRARLGLARTFQQPKVAMDLTVAENVAVGLAVRDLSNVWRTLRTMARAVVTGRTRGMEDVAAACDAVGLRDLDRPAQLLSFGELRLVEVARALVQDPGVMLLDEPFPGLEDEGAALLSSAIRGLATRGQSVVLVDHNVALVKDLVTRVVLLARGEVAFTGTVEECLVSAAFEDEYIGRRDR